MCAFYSTFYTKFDRYCTVEVVHYYFEALFSQLTMQCQLSSIRYFIFFCQEPCLGIAHRRCSLHACRIRKANVNINRKEILT